MADLIERQAAIEALWHIRCNLQMMDDTQTADKMMHGLRLAENAIELLPSAQPEKRTEERTETHSCDCISRQAAIEWCLEGLNNMPSAQPDNSCVGCKYENADDGVLVPCGFCKRSHPDNYERRTDE